MCSGNGSNPEELLILQLTSKSYGGNRSVYTAFEFYSAKPGGMESMKCKSISWVDCRYDNVFDGMRRFTGDTKDVVSTSEGGMGRSTAALRHRVPEGDVPTDSGEKILH